MVQRRARRIVGRWKLRQPVKEDNLGIVDSNSQRWPSSFESNKLLIYRAFVEGELEAPKHLARKVHDLYFNPPFEEFAPPTRWSLANAFTSAFKELDPIPQF